MLDFIKNNGIKNSSVIKYINSDNAIKYPLSDEELSTSSRGVSNRSLGNNFEINSSGKIWVFCSHLE